MLPTIADGLAVQWDGDRSLEPVLDEVVDDITFVAEPAIKTAIYGLLHHQGLLVEGAGAVGIAALLAGGERFRGRVLVVLSGGNLSPSHLAQAMAVGLDDEPMRARLGLRARRTALELARPSAAASPPAEAAADAPADAGADTLPLWQALAAELARGVETAAGDLRRHREYLDALGLPADSEVLRAAERQIELAGDLGRACTGGPAPEAWRLRARYRMLLQQIAHARNSLQWCSPSYDQSREVMFYDPGDQKSAGVNYARYGSVGLRDFELRLRRGLGLSAHRCEVVATSSGQAAYQLIESFLLRHVLAPGDTVLYAPYVYFEAREQLSSLPFLRHATCPSYRAEDVVRTA